jgi:hypothetical protein
MKSYTEKLRTQPSDAVLVSLLSLNTTLEFVSVTEDSPVIQP